MSFQFVYAVISSVLLFAVVNIGYVKSENSQCSVTGGKPDDCIRLEDCPIVKSIVQNVTNSISNMTRDYLRNIHCGWNNGNEPMVCCPPDATPIDDKSIFGASKPYTHRNLHLVSEHECGQSVKDRIIGGKFADFYEFPWMALLAYKVGGNMEFQCGGSLINERYVLTAAHCISKRLLGVRIGEHNISTSPDCYFYNKKKYCVPAVQDFEIEKIIEHNYETDTFNNDIALLRLNGIVNLKERNAHPVCLPIYNSLQNAQLIGNSAIVTGWGVTEKDKSSDVLKRVSISITTNAACEEKFKASGFLTDLHLNDNKMCAGEPGKDSCSGDSGGPLINYGFYKDRPRYVQYGIVSYGADSCTGETPGIYTKLTKYLDWILDNLKP